MLVNPGKHRETPYMTQSPASKLRLKLEDWRLRQHFKHVEHTLRSRDTRHLSPALRQARERYLDQLHMYARRGIFPRNHERPVYAPCFIDQNGCECAVAHLMMVSGHTDTARKIAAIANYDYVPQMTFSELDKWAAQTGLSGDELALIQPGYYMTFDGTIAGVAITLWSSAIVISLISAVQITRKRVGIVMPAIGLILAIVLLLSSIFCLFALTEAFGVATHADVPLRIIEDSFHAVGDFGRATVISLALAFLAGILGFMGYRRAKAMNNIVQESVD
jgi:hypothetical protein